MSSRWNKKNRDSPNKNANDVLGSKKGDASIPLIPRPLIITTSPSVVNEDEPRDDIPVPNGDENTGKATYINLVSKCNKDDPLSYKSDQHLQTKLITEAEQDNAEFRDTGDLQESAESLPMIPAIQSFNSSEFPNTDGISQTREVRNYVLVIRWITLLTFVLFLIEMLISYRSETNRACNYHLRVWSIVITVRQIVKSIVDLIHGYINSYRWTILSSVLFWIGLIFNLFLLVLLVAGFDFVILRPSCPEVTAPLIFSRALFWYYVVLFLLPLILCSILWITIPIVLLYYHHRGRLTSNRPTPETILEKMSVCKYSEIVKSVKETRNELQQPDDRNNQSLPSEQSNENDNSVIKPLSLSHLGSMLGEMTNLLNTSGSEQPSRWGFGTDINSFGGEGLAKSCPICMVDLEDDDDIMIMPCDDRHFFHRDCVIQWLRTSQICPICRANVVTIIETPSSLEYSSTTVPSVSQNTGMRPTQQSYEMV